MKKIFFVIAAAAMMLVGCTKELEQRVDTLEQKVDALQKVVDGLNTDVDAIETIVKALQNNVYVSGVEKNADGSVVIKFTNGETATLQNGAPGAAGHSPVVGVAAVDGVLYWTVDGEFILDADGNKVPATGPQGPAGENGAPGADGENGADGADGADAPVPTFEVKDGKLIMTVTVDGKTTVTDLGNVQGPAGEQGPQGETWYQDVIVGESYVTIVVNDEAKTEIKLPLYNEFNIVFGEMVIAAFNETTVEVPYTITGKDEAVVRAYASEGVTATVKAAKSLIEVAVADNVDLANAWIDVFAINNRTGEIKAKSLTFKNGVLEVAEQFVIPALGGSVMVAVETDQVYEIEFDDTWLTQVESKALRTDELEFAAEENDGRMRSTDVTLLVSGEKKAEFTVVQYAKVESLTLAETEIELPVSGTYDLLPTITPGDANPAIQWVMPAGGELVMGKVYSDGFVAGAVGGHDIAVNPEAIAMRYAANVVKNSPYTVKAVAADDPTKTAEVSVKVTAKQVAEIDVPAPKEYIAARVGQIVPLEWTVLPADADDKTVVFASTNENVIKVDDKGIVTVVGPGEAKVVISANDQFSVLTDPAEYVCPTADVVFAVSKELAASSIAFAEESVELPVKGTADITPVVGPEDAADLSVAYEVLLDGKPSSDLVVVENKVKLNPAFVTNSDLVLKVGNTYTVVASLVSNPTIKAEIDVTVTATLVESLAAEAFTTKMGQTEYTAAPVVTVNPTTADDQTIYWTVKEGDDVIKIDPNTGVIEPIKAGYATVLATAYDAFNTDYTKPRVSIEVPVTVLYADGEAPVNTMKFDAESYDFVISEGAEFDLLSKLVLDPSLKDVKLVWNVILPNHMKGTDMTTWQSVSAYSINEDGEVVINPNYWITDQTAYPSLMSGFYYDKNAYSSPYDENPNINTLKVTVYSEKDPSVKASTVVNITPKALESVSFGLEQLDMFVGKSVQIKPNFNPTDASYKGAYLGYKSDNTSVVEVDQDGNLKALAEGEATITYSAANPFAQNKELVTEVKVVVHLNAPKAITAEKEVKVVLNETVDLMTAAKVAIDPTDAATTSQELVWSIVNSNGKESAFATVTEDGKVTITDFNTYGVNNPANTYTVTVASAVDPTVKAEIAVTVTVVMPKAIEWGAEITTMNVGDEFPQIIKYISEKEGYEVTYKEVLYKSSNPAAIDFENGKLVAKAAAEDVTITCYYNGKYAPVDENGDPVYDIAPISMTFDIVE